MRTVTRTGYMLLVVATLALAAPAQAWTTSFAFEQQSPDPSPGEKVKVGGIVEGTSNCTIDRKIRIQRRTDNEDTWTTITTTRTDNTGDYHEWVGAQRTKQYRAVAVAQPHCGKQETGSITVHVK